MKYKYCCVIDRNGLYKTLVMITQEADENGNKQEKIQCYGLKEGESLINEKPPVLKLCAGAEGFIKPHWNGVEWTEAAAEEEIRRWEQENPAPVKPKPTETELLKAQLNAVTERNEFLEDCMAEMAMRMYQ